MHWPVFCLVLNSEQGQLKKAGILSGLPFVGLAGLANAAIREGTGCNTSPFPAAFCKHTTARGIVRLRKRYKMFVFSLFSNLKLGTRTCKNISFWYPMCLLPHDKSVSDNFALFLRQS